MSLEGVYGVIYIESDQKDPYYNLALEEYVFNNLDPEKEYFMLWQNKNTIVVGKYQNTAEEIDQDFVDRHGIHVVRRLSGGGAVYHDEGNLNFTFIVHKEQNPDFNFSLFVIPVINALKELGVDASFNGRNDIVINGKKFSGNSQYVKKNRIMHHGCIMLDSNLDTVQDALKVKEAKFRSKSVKSVQSRVTTINANAPRRISMQEFKNALKKHVFANNEMKTYVLTEEDRENICRLAQKKYRTWEWNYGYFPEYSIRREAKFDSGLVTVDMEIEHGIIRVIRIAGDFFGNRDVQGLEHALLDMPLDDRLISHLESLNFEEYMHGITPAEFASLLR